jgi:hypothetical protein
MRKEGLTMYIHTEIQSSHMYIHGQQLITCSSHPVFSSNDLIVASQIPIVRILPYPKAPADIGY